MEQRKTKKNKRKKKQKPPEECKECGTQLGMDYEECSFCGGGTVYYCKNYDCGAIYDENGDEM